MEEVTNKKKKQQVGLPNFVLNFDTNWKNKSYLDVQDVLSSIDQLYCWGHIIGRSVELEEPICNPFRSDNTPGCWLDKFNNLIILVDFASKEFNGMSIIEATKRKYNLSFKNALYKLLELSNVSLSTLKRTPSNFKNRQFSNFTFKISILPYHNSDGEVCFLKRDAVYWKKRYVSSANLVEDQVYSVKSYITNSKKSPNINRIRVPNTLCYAYTVNNKYKLYMPLVKQFISQLTENDIGGYDLLPEKGDLLIITKSYKDYRVIKNLGYNVIWVQGEIMEIPEYYIQELSNRFTQILFIYDNDSTGIINAQDRVSTFNSYFPNKAFYGYLRDFKDPDELIVSLGPKELRIAIKTLINESIKVARNP